MVRILVPNPVVVNVATDVFFSLCVSLIMTFLNGLNRIQNRVAVVEGRQRRWLIGELGLRGIISEWSLRRRHNNLVESVAGIFLGIVMLLSVVHPLMDAGMDFYSDHQLCPEVKTTTSINLLRLNASQTGNHDMYFNTGRINYAWLRDRGYEGKKIRLASEVARKKFDVSFGLSSRKPSLSYLGCRAIAASTKLGKESLWETCKRVAKCHGEVLEAKACHSIEEDMQTVERDKSEVIHFTLEDPVNKPKGILTWGPYLRTFLWASSISEIQSFRPFTVPEQRWKKPKVQPGEAMAKFLTIPEVHIGELVLHNSTVAYETMDPGRFDWTSREYQSSEGSDSITVIVKELFTIHFVGHVTDAQHDQMCDEWLDPIEEGKEALDRDLCDREVRKRTRLYIGGQLFCNRTTVETFRGYGRYRGGRTKSSWCGIQNTDTLGNGSAHLVVEQLVDQPLESELTGRPSLKPWTLSGSRKQRSDPGTYSWTSNGERLSTCADENGEMTLSGGPTNSMLIMFAYQVSAGGFSIEEWTMMFARGILGGRIFQAGLNEGEGRCKATLAELKWPFVGGLVILLLLTLISGLSFLFAWVQERRRGMVSFFMPQTALDWFLTAVKETVTHSLCREKPGTLEAKVVYGIIRIPNYTYDHIGFTPKPAAYDQSKQLYGRPGRGTQEADGVGAGVGRQVRSRRPRKLKTD